MLLLSHFSRVRLCATPWTAAHRAPPSLGFSRQEHRSGLPLPSPMQESEKWKWSRSVVSDSQRPHGLQPTRLLRPWDFPGKSTGVGCHCLLRLIPIAMLKTITLVKVRKTKLKESQSFPGFMQWVRGSTRLWTEYLWLKVVCLTAMLFYFRFRTSFVQWAQRFSRIISCQSWKRI